jgi:hypothetical protein
MRSSNVLSFEILDGGGVRVTGSAEELRALAGWLRQAAAVGRAAPAFVTDERLTCIEIVRVEPAADAADVG